MSAGADFTLGIRSDGSLWAWGNNSAGQLGNGTTTGQTTPSQIGTATNWSAICAGTDFTLATALN